jgi:hypothetical protein
MDGMRGCQGLLSDKEPEGGPSTQTADQRASFCLIENVREILQNEMRPRVSTPTHPPAVNT